MTMTALTIVFALLFVYTLVMSYLFTKKFEEVDKTLGNHREVMLATKDAISQLTMFLINAVEEAEKETLSKPKKTTKKTTKKTAKKATKKSKK